MEEPNKKVNRKHYNGFRKQRVVGQQRLAPLNPAIPPGQRQIRFFLNPL